MTLEAVRRPLATIREGAAERAHPVAERWALGLVLLLAVVLRVWGLPHDLPFSYYGDELHFMKRAMALGTGDLNPHWFHKPGFLMYLLAGVYGLYFLAGAAVGRFASVDAFAAHFLADQGPFLLLGRSLVLVFGVALVYLVYRLGRRVHGRFDAALAGALLTAVLPSLVGSSQEIKADVPCAFFVVLGLSLYLRADERGTWGSLAAAAVVAGVAMGTKYYGLILVPTFLAGEGLRALGQHTGRAWRRTAARSALVVALFVAGFFAVSPYNFLDPTWGRSLVHRTDERVLDADESSLFDPDSKVEFQPGPDAWGGAAVHFFGQVVEPQALGTLLTGFLGLGWLAALADRRTRRFALLVAAACGTFFLLAIVMMPFHVNARHLNAVFPLLTLFAWPAARLLTRLPRLGERRRAVAAAVLAALVAAPATARSAANDHELGHLDSRTVAYRWIVEHLPHENEGILVEDFGPILQPNPQAVERLSRRLTTLPRGPFTAHQRLRLRLLERFPPPDGVDLEELGHAWWLPAEKSDAELRSSPHDMDMGNPLISRQPRPLVTYRAEGIRWVVTNSRAQDRIDRAPDPAAAFPSFLRFYRELAGTRLVTTIDPATWSGKGPIVWVYDITEPAAPPSAQAAPTRATSSETGGR